MINLADIIALKFPGVDLIHQVQVFDDGQGPYIKTWDLNLGPQPTLKQLEAWSNEVEAAYNVKVTQIHRKREYPPLGEQLDAIWHAMDSGRLPMVSPFYDPIKAVKDKYPKS